MLVLKLEVETFYEDRRPITPKDIWMTIREIERGPRSIKSLQPLSLRRDQSATGTKDLCSTPKENARVMVESLEKTFSSQGTLSCSGQQCSPSPGETVDELIFQR
jgi:hypothetical protein